MPHVLIIGLKLSLTTDYLTRHGYTYTYLQDIKKTKFPNKKFRHRVLADFSSKETLLSVVKLLPRPIDAVMTTYENYVLPTAWIADYLSLSGLPIIAAEACTDKYIMRSLFNKCPQKISPAFDEVKSESDVRAFAAKYGFPLILKPANLAKSLLVTKSDTLDELLANYKKTARLLQATYKKYAPNRVPKLIIEEFLEGNIHSVDAFVDGKGNPHILEEIVDYQTGYDIGFDDNFHYSRLLPSRLNPVDQAALRHAAKLGIQALGMKNSPAHVEIIMTAHGPRIVEVGARNGGYRERMHRLANTIDILGAALALALGKAPQIKASKSESCGVMELFPKRPGYFKSVIHAQELQNRPSLVSYSLKVKPGDYVGKASEGYKMVAIVILHHSNPQIFQQDLAYLNEKVAIQTTPRP